MIPDNFMEWKKCIEISCGIPITSTFATKRIAELSDDNNQHTREFVKLYGDEHRRRVIGWFEQSMQLQSAY